MRFLNTILDIVFPAKCISCGKSGSDLCVLCLSDAGTAKEKLRTGFSLYTIIVIQLLKNLYGFSNTVAKKDW